METEKIQLADSEIGISNEWRFDKEKCWDVIIRRVCLYARGRIRLLGGGKKYELEISGEAGSNLGGGVTFHRRVPLVQKCYEIEVKFIKVKVCILNLDLKKRRFTLNVKVCAELPYIGEKCVTVYERDIIIAIAAEFRDLIGDDLSFLRRDAQEFAFEVFETGEPSNDCSCDSPESSPKDADMQRVLCFGINPQRSGYRPLRSDL